MKKKYRILISPHNLIPPKKMYEFWVTAETLEHCDEEAIRNFARFVFLSNEKQDDLFLQRVDVEEVAPEVENSAHLRACKESAERGSSGKEK